MRNVASILGFVLACAGSVAASAQERPFTPALTCSAIKAIVSREQNVTLASSDHAYEMVHANIMACESDETGAPAFEPSSDEPNCLAGWRCKQRNSDGSSSK